MRRHTSIAVAIWVVVTLLALAGAAVMNPFPTQASLEAHTIDHAFRVMSFMAAPVLGMVVAILAYSLLRFRGKGPEEAGIPFRGTGMIPRVWLLATSALCVTVIIYPGLTGLADLRSDQNADLHVNVTAARWTWAIEYVESGVTVGGSQELVLPVNRRVEFDINSVDVLHAFWVPAFRLRIDAVPGQTTKLFLTPTKEGSEDTDAAYRLQCSQLCGLGHANMAMPVRVVSQDAFAAWIKSGAAAAAPAAPSAGGVPAAVELSEFAIKAPATLAAGPVNFQVKNVGSVPHEFVVIQTDQAPDKLPQSGGAVDEKQLKVLGRTSQLSGGAAGGAAVTLGPGKYVLICNVPGHYQLGMRTGLTVQ